jgi:hypothetical protein
VVGGKASGFKVHHCVSRHAEALGIGGKL